MNKMENGFLPTVRPRCLECEDRYVADPQQLECAIENCDAYEPTSGVCPRCNSDYQPSNNRTHCLKRDQFQNCEIIDDITFNCLKCNDEFGIFWKPDFQYLDN